MSTRTTIYYKIDKNNSIHIYTDCNSGLEGLSFDIDTACHHNNDTYLKPEISKEDAVILAVNILKRFLPTKENI